MSAKETSTGRGASLERGAPAAPAQNPLWLLQQLDPTSSAYNLAFHLELEGPLDADAMAAAWSRVLERHEILRCRFVPGEDGAHLIPLPARAAQLGRSRTTEAGAKAAIRAASLEPFDLHAGPPCRAHLYETGEQRHRLAFAFHHAVFDGWSLNLLLSEMAAAYDHALGLGPALPPLPQSYLDYARRAAAAHRGEGFEAELAYWQEQLRGAPAELDLPHRRRAQPSPRTGRTLRSTYPGLADPLQALSARAEATPFMVMLAAYATLLTRYTDATELVVGTPLATRIRPSVRPLIGLFLNTVALRICCAGSPTFLELVGRVKEAALGAFRNYRLPFERVVEALHPERRTGQNPLFSTMFITQNAPVSYRFSGLRHRYHDDDPAAAKFDLTVSTQITEEDLDVSLEYADDRLDAVEAQGMMDAYRVLLGHALEDPERTVLDLSWMDRAADRVQIARFCGPTSSAPLLGTLDAVEARARAHPDRVAVEDAEGRRTYGEVWRQAERIARGLAARGVGPGQRVGVRVARDRALPETLLGVLLTGAAYIPLDPDAPLKRRQLSLEDARAEVLLVDRPEPKEAPPGTTLVERDALSADGELGPRPGLEATAYVIYTSGSSGRPKGVIVPHRGLSAFHRAAISALELRPQDRLLATATVSFDPSVLELLTPLTVGASTYVVPRDVAVDGERLAKAIGASKASILQTTPTALRLLVNAGWQPSRGLRVLVGGEPLPRDLAQDLVGRVGALINVYGPTEATVWSAGLRVRPEDLEEGPDVVPVGGVFPDVRYYLLCSRGRPVPPGARGEICISGPQVTDGYVGRPALDASRFVTDPYAPHATMYRTGDVGRARPDGSIEFLGRSDLQLKIRGFRVEPAEIEASLRRQPGIRDAVVTTMEREGVKELIAYVVGEAAIEQDTLRAALREELPAYMVPAFVQSLGEIPRNANGKLDRGRLPEPAPPPRAQAYAAPVDEVEARLLELWRTLLGRRDIGTDDNFFDVGGHSMLAARLADRVHRSFGRRLDVSTFFHAQTVTQQAQAIRDGGYTPLYTALEPLKTSGTRRPLFYIGASDQARLLSEHLHAEQPMYVLKALGLPNDHSMEVVDVAAAYVDQIRSFQPDGPYAIGGYCQDAKLALAVAEQLQAQKAEVARMVYLDVIWLPPERLDLKRQFVDNFTEMGPEYAVHYVRQRAADRYRTAKQGVYDAVMSRLARTGLKAEPPATTRHRERIAALRASIAAYPERPFVGDVDILLSQEYHRAGAARALGHMATGRVRVFEIPGLHHRMFAPPSVYWLGARISTCLEEAFSAGGESAPSAPPPRADEDRV